MSDSSRIQVRQVHKRLGESFAFGIEQLDIAAGEVLALLGPTGSGKSTFLRMLAGVDSSGSGQILIDGQKLTPQNTPLALRRSLTLVFQRPLLLSGTVRANVEYGLRLRGGRRSSARVDTILERLRLERLARQSARTLSGGQTQLVALARAIAIQPDVLLLDEPTANLDPAHVALVEQVLADDHDERGTTVVWATHNMFQARRVAHRVGLLLNGELVEVAPSETFFESPKDSRAADFVQGKMVY